MSVQVDFFVVSARKNILLGAILINSEINYFVLIKGHFSETKLKDNSKYQILCKIELLAENSKQISRVEE